MQLDHLILRAIDLDIFGVVHQKRNTTGLGLYYKKRKRPLTVQLHELATDAGSLRAHRSRSGAGICIRIAPGQPWSVIGGGLSELSRWSLSRGGAGRRRLQFVQMTLDLYRKRPGGQARKSGTRLGPGRFG